MLIREMTEKIEEMTLSKYATLAKNSKGRDKVEKECDIRTVFQRDRDRILHSKSFRRLKHKTQVFLNPIGDHYRTRLTHTLEVSQIARTIGKALRLNEDLIEAIALGHDLGHTPFGHAGERALNEVYSKGFEHCVQSLRIVEKLERNGEGLNLTKEVRDGILNHRTSGHPFTLEGQVVRLSDKIAYINHDIDDAIGAKIMKDSELPKSITDVLGNSVKKRIDFLIKNAITNSMDKDKIILSKDAAEALKDLKKWLFENLYNSDNKKNIAKVEEHKADVLLKVLYAHYQRNTNELPKEYIELIKKGENKNQIVVDYISGMTDDFAIHTYERIYVPKGWSKL